MPFPRRMLGLFAETAGLAGLSACLAGLAGCWWLHGRLNERLDRVYGRINGALIEIVGDMAGARERLRKVGHDLDAVRANPPDRPSNKRPGRRPLTGKAIAAAEQQLGEIKPQLVRAVELGVVVDGLLDALADLWLAERVGIDTGRLNQASDQLSALIGKAQKLTSAVEGPVDAEIAGEPRRLAEGVDRLVAILDEAAERADGTRERSVIRQARLRRHHRMAACIATAVLVWAGLGQFTLFLHGRRLARLAASERPTIGLDQGPV